MQSLIFSWSELNPPYNLHYIQLSFMCVPLQEASFRQLLNTLFVAVPDHKELSAVSPAFSTPSTDI